LPHVCEVMGERRFPIRRPGAHAEQNGVRQALGSTLDEISLNQTFSASRYCSDCSTTGFCTTVSLSVEHKPAAHEGAVTFSQRPCIHGRELRVPSHRDDARQTMVTEPPSAFDQSRSLASVHR